MKTTDLTPIEKIGNYYFKRDDYLILGKANGGKIRGCLRLSQNAKGLTTAGSRHSIQVYVVIQIAKYLNIPCHIHIPSGEIPKILKNEISETINVIQHKMGFNNVLIKRAKDDAKENEFIYIPWGLECNETIEETKNQVKNIPLEVKRMIVPVGGGMTLASILIGLKENNLSIPVVGVCVGADPIKRLDKYIPEWRNMCELVESKYDYNTPYPNPKIGELELESLYEAKCIDYLKDGDLLWIVGKGR